jgi:hypothetical protein
MGEVVYREAKKRRTKLVILSSRQKFRQTWKYFGFVQWNPQKIVFIKFSHHKIIKKLYTVATESRLKIFFGSKEPWSMPPQVEVWRNIVNLCPLSWSCEIVARVAQDKKIFENWSTLPYLAS